MQDQQLRRAVKFIANESQLSPNCPSRASSWVRQCPPGSNGTLLDGQQLYRGQSIPSKRSSINCVPVLGTSCIFGESWTNHQATRDAQSSHMYYQYYHVPTCFNNHMESLELDLATSCNSLSLLVQLCHAKTLQIWVERDLGEVLAKQKKLSPTRQKRNAKWPKIYQNLLISEPNQKFRKNEEKNNLWCKVAETTSNRSQIWSSLSFIEPPSQSTLWSLLCSCPDGGIPTAATIGDPQASLITQTGTVLSITPPCCSPSFVRTCALFCHLRTRSPLATQTLWQLSSVLVCFEFHRR